ncbi:MAG: glycosyltransferase family 39 protein [Ardenticatenia bacterium]|nr:glycosyltransferase family 39 protein [Ardenticatenia bacterium]
MRQRRPAAGAFLPIIGVLILFAFWVRLQGLSARTFWQDEGLTLWQIRQPLAVVWSGTIVVQGVPTQNTHPPLYFLLLWGARHLMGISPFAVRFFSVWWSLIGVAAIAVFGARLGGRRAGILAALLAATSPLYLWYAQEVRMYAMLVALSALSTYWLARVIERPSARTLGAYGVTTWAMAWTHYSALFLLAAQAGVLGTALVRRRPRLVVGSVLGALVVISPFVPFLVRRLLTGVERGYFFVPLRVMARDLWHGFTVGITLPTTVSWPLELLALLALVLGAWWAGQRYAHHFPRPGIAWAALAWPALLVVPVLLLYVASYIKPMYQGVRHLMIISPTFYALAGAGLAWLAGRHSVGKGASWTLIALWFLGIGVSTWNYFLEPSYQKDDTRGLFAYIAEYFRPGDIVVLRDAVLSHLLEYERPGLPWTALPNYGTSADQPEARQQFEAVLAEAERVWYVFSPVDTLLDPQLVVDRWMAERAFPLDVRRFRGQTTELGVLYYDPHGALAPEPQPMTDRLNVVYTNGVTLLGANVPSREVQAGERFFFDVVWETRHQPQQDFKVSVRLTAPDGTVWAMEDRVPFPQVHPPSMWVPNGYRRSPHSLRIPLGTPPGQYDVSLVLYSAADGAPVAREDGGEAVPLGQVIVRPGSGPRSTWRPPVNVTANITGRFRLEGAEAWPEQLRVGARLALTFYVRLLSPEARTDRLVVELVGPGERVANIVQAPLVPDFADATALGPRTLLRVPVTLHVPPVGPSGRYRVRVRALTSGEQVLPWRLRWWWRTDRITLGTVIVEDRPRRFDLPAGGRPVEAKWSQGVTLARARWPDRVVPGTSFTIQLIWRAAGATDRSYKIFVHLRDSSGRPVAQGDAYPANGAAPTNGWLQDEVIVDEHIVPVPADIPAGTYALVVGLYDEATGQRLPLAGGGDEVMVGTVRVEPP